MSSTALQPAPHHHQYHHSHQPTLSSPLAHPSGHSSPGWEGYGIDANNPSLDYQHSNSSSDRRKMPPVAPPRTSSNQQSTTNSNPRKNGYPSEKQQTSRRPHTADSHPMENTVYENGMTNEAAYASSGRGSRNYAYPQEQTQRSGHARQSQGPPGGIPIRTQQQQQQPRQPQPTTSSKQPSREASEALNRAIASQPDPRSPNSNGHVTSPTRVAEDASHGAPAQSSEHQETRRGVKGRHDQSKTGNKVFRLGDYILGNTIGEGEFGKVKLGWKQQDGAYSKQFAIKLIKKDNLGENPSRLAKVWREVAILKRVSHPNIVRLIDTQDRDKYIGIILEYASGGELFDFILSQRSLSENVAKRLFAQLISGVGYLHKKGIVHRDLKLENLLLDSHRNIIITDFGFANTFDSTQELSEEEELGLIDKEFVKKLGLDKYNDDGTRKADLMQTSCGSPCYAAPELVISDSLYTGRKVDVWSCGVILYAMLAGYLPFDDDPANPEGDNIHQLYRYIVSTPLVFPETVAPGARDLLRRILVPNPRKRADLFEVARHSWLSDYASVVEFITSATTSPKQIQNSTVHVDGAPMVARSTSVRDSNRSKATASPAIGGLGNRHGHIDSEDANSAPTKQHSTSKRRTVQVEYVAPSTQTRRGEPSAPPLSGSGGSSSRARPGSQGQQQPDRSSQLLSNGDDKPLPNVPASKDPRVNRKQQPNGQQGYTPPGTSYSVGNVPTSGNHDMQSSAANTGRVTQGQPVPPEVAGTVAQGRIQQPNGQSDDSRNSPSRSGNVPAKFARVSGFNEGPGGGSEVKTHRRSNTLGELGSKIIGRSGSLFGRGNRKRAEQPSGENKKRYPPVSMANAMPQGDTVRQSTDSRRSMSYGFTKKRSGSIASSQEKRNRRFSFLPQSFSLKAIGLGSGGEHNHHNQNNQHTEASQSDLPIQDPNGNESAANMSQSQVSATNQASYYGEPDLSQYNVSPVIEDQDAALQQNGQQQQQPQHQAPMPAYMMEGAVLNTGSESSLDNSRYRRRTDPRQREPEYPEHDNRNASHSQNNKASRAGLQKHKRFSDAYDDGGEGGAARKVMALFRLRGKQRNGEAR